MSTEPVKGSFANALAHVPASIADLAGPGGRPVEVVYRAATIHTMDPANPMATGIWVRGDRIVAAGDADRLTAAALASGSRPRLVDLGGRHHRAGAHRRALPHHPAGLPADRR